LFARQTNPLFLIPLVAVKDVVFRARLDADLKERFDAWCHAQGRTASQMFRQIVQRAVSQGRTPTGEAEPAANAKALDARRSVRLHLRLTPAEYSAAERHAAPYGGVREWVVGLIRSQITHGQPQFSRTEVDAMLQANRQLAAIGRNINQIAHALNLDALNQGRASLKPSHSADLERLAEALREHRLAMRELVNRATDRWTV